MNMKTTTHAAQLELAKAPLAVLGIGQAALTEMVAAMALQGHVDDIKRNLRSCVYWPEFCRLAAADQVPKDFAGPGIIGRCVLGWAQQDAGAAMGMAWWNQLTQEERLRALRSACAWLRHEPSVAEAWELWRQGKIHPCSYSEPRSWIGKRVICYSGPHYGRVHQVEGVSESLADLYHSTSGDRFSAPFCDLEEVA